MLACEFGESCHSKQEASCHMCCVNMETQLVGYITLFTLVHCNVAQHLKIPIMWAGKEKASAEREEIVEYGKEKEGNKTVHGK